MNRRAVLCCVLAAVLLLTITTWSLRNKSSLIWNLIPVTYSGIQSSRPTSSILHLQDPILFANESDFNCVTAKLDHQMEFPFCTYNESDDIYISRVFLRGNYYERDYVLRTVNFTKRHPDVTFLDIGANLGTYALPVAHAGRHVVAVEPNWNTLRRLSKAVYLGGVGSNIDLLHYAISENRSTTFMKYNPVNRGRAEMSDEDSCEKDCVKVSVSVVTLNDILPIMRNKKVIVKVDVEGSERNVFTSSGADEFFREADVLIIQMEWSFYPMYFSQTLEKRLLVDKFLNFFYEKNYTIYNARTEEKLHSKWMEWPNDICFRKAEITGRLYDM